PRGGFDVRDCGTRSYGAKLFRSGTMLQAARCVASRLRVFEQWTLSPPSKTMGWIMEERPPSTLPEFRDKHKLSGKRGQVNDWVKIRLFLDVSCCCEGPPS